MFEILKKRLVILIIIPITAVFAAATVSLTMVPVYRTSATIMVTAPSAGGAVSDYNSLILNRQLVKTYCELAVGQDSLQEVAGQLGISPGELAKKIIVSPVKDLELLRISVKDQNPERAAFIANNMVEVLRKKTRFLYQSDNIRVVSFAQIPVKQEQPDILVNTIAAGMAGLIVTIIIIFWLEDKSLRNKARRNVKGG